MTSLFALGQKVLRPAALLSLGLLGLAGCQTNIDAPQTPTAGNANVTTYIAVGNSLTAGYQSNGLSRAGQLNSYPAILSRQFAQVGGGAFNQPLFEVPYAHGSGYLRLAAITNGSPVLAIVTDSLAVISGSLKTGTNLLRKYTGTDNQNLGVPGIRVSDVTTPGYGYNNPVGFNPFFERLLPSALPGAAQTYLQYVQERVATLKPTFFSNWLGNNDVLGYATSGGASSADPLTPVADFTTKYKQVLDALTSGGAKGVIATIPNVTNVPLFTTVKASLLKALIKSNSALPNASAASLYIRTGANTTREATDNDYILLTAQAVFGTGASAANPLPIGVGYSVAQSNPLPSQYVLDADEAAAVIARTSELNAVIRTEATNRGLALFDANVYFQGVAANGYATNAITNNTNFITGNLFSLDGVHPTSRGYALIANEMIKAINARYGAVIAQVNANQYPGVLLP